MHQLLLFSYTGLIGTTNTVLTYMLVCIYFWYETSIDILTSNQKVGIHYAALLLATCGQTFDVVGQHVA